MDGLCLEGAPPMLMNGHCLGREPHTESLPVIGLNIKDLSDAVLKVLVLCHAPHHGDDVPIHWGDGPAPLSMAGLSGVGGGGCR